jgi:hypothetical protein
MHNEKGAEVCSTSDMESIFLIDSRTAFWSFKKFRAKSQDVKINVIYQREKKNLNPKYPVFLGCTN